MVCGWSARFDPSFTQLCETVPFHTITSGRVVCKQKNEDLSLLLNRAFNLLLFFTNDQQPLYLQAATIEQEMTRIVCTAEFPGNIHFVLEVSNICDKVTDYSVSLVVGSETKSSSAIPGKLSYDERFAEAFSQEADYFAQICTSEQMPRITTANQCITSMCLAEYAYFQIRSIDFFCDIYIWYLPILSHWFNYLFIALFEQFSLAFKSAKLGTKIAVEQEAISLLKLGQSILFVL